MTTSGVYSDLKLACALFLLCVVTAIESPAQTVKTLVNFGGGNGGSAAGPLVQGFDGNLYGTSGVFFKIALWGTLTPSGTNTSGSFGLVQSANGTFYGTTANAGSHGQGSVFMIAPTGKLTTLYSFCAQSNCPDGANPAAGLVRATNGYFYGTTTRGGAHGAGTIFEMAPAGALTTLYNFCAQTNCADGGNPGAVLIQANDRSLYGTTRKGGSHGIGWDVVQDNLSWAVH